MLIDVGSDNIIIDFGSGAKSSSHPRGSLSCIVQDDGNFRITRVDGTLVAAGTVSTTIINGVRATTIQSFYQALETTGFNVATVSATISTPSPIDVEVINTTSIPVDVRQIVPINFDNTQLGAFGNLRVIQTQTLFSNSYFEDTNPESIEVITTSGGTSVLNRTDGCVDMTVSAPGDSVLRQSRKYYRYQPGKGQQFTTTFRLPLNLSNVTVRRGVYDSGANKSIGIITGNGVFIQASNSIVSLCVRKNDVDTEFPQSSWNVDRFDGTGPSGITIDWTKSQILRIDFQWLGVGRVRYGFIINGTLYWAHFADHSNLVDSTYMATANLPFRTEIIAEAGLLGARVLKDICSEISSQGGDEPLGRQETTFRPAATPNVGALTRYPIISVRAKADYNRIAIRPLYASIQTVSGSGGRLEIWRNAVLTGSSFLSLSLTSATEVDYSATSMVVTNAKLLSAEGFSPQESGKSSPFRGSLLDAVSSISGTRDVLTLAVFRTETTSTDTFTGEFSWLEFL